jgi:glycerophosphoryl diester phosphodiesterase
MDWKEFRATYAPDRPMIVAHRGVPLVEPENTLASFQRALDQGADALETDIRFTRDNVLVCFHDATLERMTDGTGPVRARTLAELKELRTRKPNGMWSTQRIPTLLELITLTQARVPLLLELKDPLFTNPAHARVLADTLAATGMTANVAIASFHFDYVQGVQAVAPEIPIGFITLKALRPRAGARILGPLWPILLLNPWYMEKAHAQGSIVAPLDPNPEARMDWYLSLDVDALLANYPASVRRALDEVTSRPRSILERRA